MQEPVFLTMDQLEASLDQLRQSPLLEGSVDMIVARPAVDERVEVEEGRLELAWGLVGDGWKARALARSPDKEPNPDVQLTLMNSRVVHLLAGDRSRWALAGDQLFVDLDLSAENLPVGTLLAVGEAILVVTAEPHTGCAKFIARYGSAAMRFVNSPVGRSLKLRGIYCRVVRDGAVRRGDVIRKLAGEAEQQA